MKPIVLIMLILLAPVAHASPQEETDYRRIFRETFILLWDLGDTKRFQFDPKEVIGVISRFKENRRHSIGVFIEWCFFHLGDETSDDHQRLIDQSALLVLFLKWSFWLSDGDTDLEGIVTDRITTHEVIRNMVIKGTFNEFVDRRVCRLLVESAYGKRV